MLFLTAFIFLFPILRCLLLILLSCVVFPGFFDMLVHFKEPVFFSLSPKRKRSEKGILTL